MGIRRAAVLLGPVLAGLAGLGVSGPAARAANLPAGFEEEIVASGLNVPTSFCFLPGNRVLVAEQVSANVRLVIDGNLVASPVITVPDVSTGGERGLLALAVDPEWPARNFVYAYYTYNDGQTADDRLTRYTAVGDLDGTGDGLLTLDPASALHLLTGVPDLASNHNGGDLRFGNDGMLYVSIGDDAATRCLAQDLTSPLGKVLRLKVSHLSPTATGSVARSELDPGDNPFVGMGETAALVYAYGLRNPFRMDVDPGDGSLFVADVGQSSFEEVDHVDSPGPNLGWPFREADAVFVPGGCIEPPNFTYQSPIDAYSHAGHGSLAVISIGVYRTPAAKTERWPTEYEGDYFYTDFYEGWVVRLDGSGQTWSVAAPAAGQPEFEHWATGLAAQPVDFAWGGDGALYYLSLGTGTLRRIHYPAGVPSASTSMSAFRARW